jgi:GAF domain-containing protein
MAVPLFWQEQARGIITMARPGVETPFTEDDESTARLFAVQTASALENLRLLEQQQQALSELNAINRRLTGEAWSEYFKQTADQARQIQIARSDLQPLEETWLPEVEMAVLTQKPISWSQQRDKAASSPFQSAMAAPIVLRGEVIGALQVGDVLQPRAWTQDELNFIQAVADQVALAIENARLIEETERRAQREAQLNQITQKIREAANIDAILSIAAEQLGQAFGTPYAHAQVGGPDQATDHPNGDQH